MSIARASIRRGPDGLIVSVRVVGVPSVEADPIDDDSEQRDSGGSQHATGSPHEGIAARVTSGRDQGAIDPLTDGQSVGNRQNRGSVDQNQLVVLSETLERLWPRSGPRKTRQGSWSVGPAGSKKRLPGTLDPDDGLFHIDLPSEHIDQALSPRDIEHPAERGPARSASISKVRIPALAIARRAGPTGSSCPLPPRH